MATGLVNRRHGGTGTTLYLGSTADSAHGCRGPIRDRAGRREGEGNQGRRREEESRAGGRAAQTGEKKGMKGETGLSPSSSQAISPGASAAAASPTCRPCRVYYVIS